MIEPDHRGAHWQSTRANAFIAIGLLAVVLALASIFSGLLSGVHFLGFPFSYYLAGQGAFILMIVLVFWLSGRQEKTDRRHGASEEI